MTPTLPRASPRSPRRRTRGDRVRPDTRGMNMPDRVVAIDVGGTNLKGAVVDRHGRCLSSQRRPTGAEGGSEAVVDAVVGLAQELASSSTDDEDSQAVATGIAVPGLVDESTGTVQVAANLGW